MRKIFATVAILLTLMSPVAPSKLAVTQPVAAQAGWYSEIATAAAYYGIPGQTDYLYSVMLCESGGNPNAVNPVTGDTGLFQFNPNTFYAWGGQNIWDPQEQIMLAAWAFSRGLQSHWVCA